VLLLPRAPEVRALREDINRRFGLPFFGLPRFPAGVAACTSAHVLSFPPVTVRGKEHDMNPKETRVYPGPLRKRRNRPMPSRPKGPWSS